MSRRRASTTILLLMWAGAASAQSQPSGGNALPPFIAQPIPIYKVGLGSFSRKISSSNAEAQAFFDQGFQLMYSFAKYDAVRSFREAWKRDPQCAMCYWGEAWAWGSNLNQVMTPFDAPFAFAAVQKALSLKDKATDRERAMIDALAQRYVEHFDPAARGEQDKAYARAMAKVYETYPDDLDIGTLYADALFHLEARPGPPPGRRPRLQNLDSPNVRRIHEVLEGLLARDPHHPGACHWYVHATEATAKAAMAQPCAETLGQSIPGASHINHMPSHTFNEVGRWGDSVRANVEAWHSDLKASVGEGFAIYAPHNLHMLVYAASMDGQGAIAMRAGRDYAKLTGGDTMFQLLTLIRFGRFDEVSDVIAPAEGDISIGVWEFAYGYASLRTGQRDAAGAHLASLRTLAEHSVATFNSSARHPARRVLGLLVGILEGEIARVSGDVPAAVSAFERAVALDDELEVDEPEPLPFPARHWLGAFLLEAKRPVDAERVYREDLRQHPHNGWSLLGLQLALKAQGKPTADVDADLQASWSRSDTWIRASRF
ncbi:MAG: tetratricopeptide repeat protein [Vicinamibacterales bacterium]